MGADAAGDPHSHQRCSPGLDEGGQKGVKAESPLDHAYETFNARDIDTVISMMCPDVECPTGMEGGYLHGREAVRVQPIGYTHDSDGRIVIEVHQIVRDLSGAE